jgi:hypothetical protein
MFPLLSDLGLVRSPPEASGLRQYRPTNLLTHERLHLRRGAVIRKTTHHARKAYVKMGRVGQYCGGYEEVTVAEITQ